MNFNSIIYTDQYEDYEVIQLSQETREDFVQQSLLYANKYLQSRKSYVQNFSRKLFSENSFFVLLQLTITLLKSQNLQCAMQLSIITYKVFYFFSITKFFILTFQLLKTKEDRKYFFHNLKTILCNFMKKLLMLKIIHVFFKEIMKFFPTEDQPYFLENLNKIKETEEEQKMGNSKNYLYLGLAIFISVSSVIVLYKKKKK